MGCRSFKGKTVRKIPVGRRYVPGRRNRGRAYVFVRSGGKAGRKIALLLSRRQKMIALTALIMFLLALIYSGFIRPPERPAPVYQVEPVSASLPEQGSEDCYLHLLQQILLYEIPGMEQPAVTGSGQVFGALCTVMRFVTGIDPRDPCSLLDLELGVGPGFSLPVLLPPSPELPDAALPDSQTYSSDPAEPPWGGSFFPFSMSPYGEVPILLYHTHASETFTAGSGEKASSGRSVVTVGEELARLLEENYGFQVHHHRAVYDLPRRYAYSKARPVIEKILEENSTIKVVIDLHRDGVPRAKTTACLEGRELAALLLVVGSRNPAYEENLAFILCLQNELEAVLPGLSRGIFQQDFTYNQDLHPFAILIEVGGHENSIDEALLTLPYLAEALARTCYIFFMQD